MFDQVFGDASEKFDLKKCDCCGSDAVLKKEDVDIKEVEGTRDELTLYVCMICGDSRAVETLEDSDQLIEKKTFQVSMRPKLEEFRRKDRARNAIHHEYLYGKEEITEQELNEEIERRRRLLSSVVKN